MTTAEGARDGWEIRDKFGKSWRFEPRSAGVDAVEAIARRWCELWPDLAPFVVIVMVEL